MIPSRLMHQQRQPGGLPRAYESVNRKSVYLQNTAGDWYEFDLEYLEWSAGIPHGVVFEECRQLESADQYVRSAEDYFKRKL